MKLKEKKYRYLFMVWICIFAFALVRRTLQNDTFYTIKIGELIINNGIDMLDHFSIHTLAYTYPHWLFDAMIYLIFKGFGYTGIYIFTIITFFILTLLIYKVNRLICHNDLMAGLATIVSILAISGFITARAQLVSYVLFISEIYFIEAFLAKNNKRYLIGLVLISLILCNMHVAVWPFYFILYLPYIAEYLVSKLFNKIKANNKVINFIKARIVFEENPNVKYLFIPLVLSIFTGLITPIGNTPYTYLIKTMAGNSQKYIQEHQRITWGDSPFTIIIAAETLFLTFFSKTKLRDLFMICGLILMNIVSIRHLALLALIGTVCFGRIFASFLATYSFDPIKFKNFLKKKGVIITMFILVIIFSGVITYQRKDEKFINKKAYPVDAVKYIKENIDISKMRLFNDYNFGSYLLLNDIPVFIDSRADLYTKQFSGLDYDIFDDYQNMGLNYQEKFEFYGITHALIYKTTSPVSGQLEKDKNYKLLYEDDNFFFYEKLGLADYVITYSDNVNFKIVAK